LNSLRACSFSFFKLKLHSSATLASIATKIRRITGYLVGTLDRFNDAKRAEERDRVKHGLSAPAP